MWPGCLLGAVKAFDVKVRECSNILPGNKSNAVWTKSLSTLVHGMPIFAIGNFN